MGEYFRGDVILAPIQLGNRSRPKGRPALVLAVQKNTMLHVCPISSQEPYDAPFTSISLHDFANGGLDMFDDSFVLTSYLCNVRTTDVIGKKGRLKDETLEVIVSMACK
jgi:mRNA interferase MazF